MVASASQESPIWPTSAAGGGAYTPLFISQGNAAFPSVAWDSTFNQFVMAYATFMWSGIYVRYSSDGINWSTRLHRLRAEEQVLLAAMLCFIQRYLTPAVVTRKRWDRSFTFTL